MKKLSMSGVFVTVLACIFAVAILGTLLFGVSVYKSVATDSVVNQDRRVCMGYINQKVHGSDKLDMVYVTDFCGIQALCIDEQIDDSLYHTMIYAYGGKLREISYLDGLEFNPEDGDEIADVDTLDFMQIGEVITVTVTDAEGNSYSGAVYLRSGEVAA